MWDGKSKEEWREIWRLERLREDEMLAFHDEVGGKITGKALAEKFNLSPSRVCKRLRRRREEQERGRMANERERLHAEIERLKASAAFTAIAERLWMDLEWLATELESSKSGSDQASNPSPERPLPEGAGPESPHQVEGHREAPKCVRAM